MRAMPGRFDRRPAQAGRAAALAAGGLLASAAPAFAEVCDQVSQSWQRGDAPVGLLGPVLLLGIGASLLLAWRTGSALIAFPAAGMCLLLALVSVADMQVAGDFYAAATAEGCRSAARDLRDAAALVVLAGAFIYAWGRRRGSASTTDSKKT